MCAFLQLDCSRGLYIRNGASVTGRKVPFSPLFSGPLITYAEVTVVVAVGGGGGGGGVCARTWGPEINLNCHSSGSAHLVC